MIRIIKQGLETELLVEKTRSVVDSIDFHSPYADVLGEMFGSTKGVNQKQ